MLMKDWEKLGLCRDEAHASAQYTESVQRNQAPGLGVEMTWSLTFTMPIYKYHFFFDNTENF